MIVSINYRENADMKMFTITPHTSSVNGNNIIWNDYRSNWGPGGSDEEILAYIARECDM